MREYGFFLFGRKNELATFGNSFVSFVNIFIPENVDKRYIFIPENVDKRYIFAQEGFEIWYNVRITI